MVVVTHRPKPEGWNPDAPFHFVDGVEAAVATARELAGDRTVEVDRVSEVELAVDPAGPGEGDLPVVDDEAATVCCLTAGDRKSVV